MSEFETAMSEQCLLDMEFPPDNMHLVEVLSPAAPNLASESDIEKQSRNKVSILEKFQGRTPRKSMSAVRPGDHLIAEESKVINLADNIDLCLSSQKDTLTEQDVVTEKSLKSYLKSAPASETLCESSVDLYKTATSNGLLHSDLSENTASVVKSRIIIPENVQARSEILDLSSGIGSSGTLVQNEDLSLTSNIEQKDDTSALYNGTLDKSVLLEELVKLHRQHLRDCTDSGKSESKLLVNFTMKRSTADRVNVSSDAYLDQLEAFMENKFAGIDDIKRRIQILRSIK